MLNARAESRIESRVERMSGRVEHRCCFGPQEVGPGTTGGTARIRCDCGAGLEHLINVTSAREVIIGDF
jgi:hypothetical protein